MTVTGARTAPTPSAVRRRIADRRERRHRTPRSVGPYETVLYVTVVAGLVAGILARSYGAVPVRPPGWVVGIAALGAAFAAARLLLAVGPLVAGPAQRAWVLSTPVRRRGLLTPGFALVLGGAGLVAGAVAVVAALLAGAPAPAVAAAGGGGLAAGAALAAVAVVIQSTDAPLAPVLRGCDVAVVGCAAAVLATASGRPGDGGDPPLALLGAVAALVALFAGVVARARLDRVPARRLAAGHALVRAALVSVRYLDPGVVAGLARERAARATGRVRPARLRGPRPAALLRADLARIRRSPGALVVLALLVPVPSLAVALEAPALVGAVQAVCATLAAHRLAGGLRLVGGSAALRRMVGGHDRSVQRIHLVWPATGALLHVGLSSLLAPPGVVAALLSLVGAVAVVHRTATRPPLDYAGSAFDVGLLGPLPVGLALQVLRGPVLLAVLVAVQVAIAAP